MRILHISSSDFGGAGIAALRLHDAMLKEGIQSSFMSLDNQINDGINYFRFNKKIDEVIVKPEYPFLSIKNYLKERFFKTFSISNEKYFKKLKEDKLKYSIAYNSSEFEVFSTPFSPYDITESDAYKQADIIHLHWVAGYLDYPSFFEKNHKPIVWTIHDENPFRGGFHYKEDEIRNQAVYHAINKEYAQVKYLSIIKSKSITIVSPSKWLAIEARKSKVFSDRKVVTIYNTLDNTIFKPLDKKFAREFWGIPENTMVLMFAAQSLDNKRKGFDLLLPIIKENNIGNIFYLVVGKKNNEINNPNVIFTGSIDNERLMALTYSASDYFVLPSREDNLPNTMLESISCGTPLITFPIGDFNEIISSSGCGIVAESISTHELDKIISNIEKLNTFERHKLVKFSNDNFNPKSQVQFYLNEYLEILN